MNLNAQSGISNLPKQNESVEIMESGLKEVRLVGHVPHCLQGKADSIHELLRQDLIFQRSLLLIHTFLQQCNAQRKRRSCSQLEKKVPETAPVSPHKTQKTYILH